MGANDFLGHDYSDPEPFFNSAARIIWKEAGWQCERSDAEAGLHTG